MRKRKFTLLHQNTSSSSMGQTMYQNYIPSLFHIQTMIIGVFEYCRHRKKNVKFGKKCMKFDISRLNSTSCRCLQYRTYFKLKFLKFINQISKIFAKLFGPNNLTHSEIKPTLKPTYRFSFETRDCF